jgi:hypothetical protein
MTAVGRPMTTLPEVQVAGFAGLAFSERSAS